jgi:DNA-binding NarL/FixJ family response regulator
MLESADGDTGLPGIRVLVVDDHLAFADLLAFALSAQPDVTCVGVSTTIDEGIAASARTRPDVVLLDIAINGEDGLLAVPRFREAAPGTAIVILTAHRGGSRVRQADQAGAAAFVAKDGPLTDVLDALRGLDGDRMVMARSTRTRDSGAADGVACRLTAREHDVLDGLGQGLPPKLIARSLGITVQTCRGYLKTVMTKLGTGTQLETVVAAQQLGLLQHSRDA